jgi:hypothetical protein
MADQCLPDHRTPISPQALYLALKAAAPLAVGCELSRASLLVLLAQIDEETGWRSCHANNLGNVKHVKGDGHDYVMFSCSEVIEGVDTPFDPPHPTTWFRAYATLDEGCVDYLRLLQRRFYLAWAAVLTGDPAQFAHLLRTQHYYTADEARYTAAVVALDKQIDAEIPKDAPVEPAPFTDALPVVAVDEQPTPPGDLPPAIE